MIRTRTSKPLLAVAISVAVTVLAGAVVAGRAEATTGPAPHVLVNVAITDSKTTLSKLHVQDVNYVDFFLHNNGKLSHNFRIGTQTSRALKPGAREHFFVGFPVFGYYRYSTTLHGKPGMKGRFKVDSPEPPD
jgi:plastocyanin